MFFTVISPKDQLQVVAKQVKSSVTRIAPIESFYICPTAHGI